VVDVSGAIYVLGGTNDNGSTNYNDVWVSTDGGVRLDSVKLGGTKGGTRGVLREY
jgi:hypothetical protein